MSCFIEDDSASTPIHIVTTDGFAKWLTDQPVSRQNWFTASTFRAEAGRFQLIPKSDGALDSVVCTVANQDNLWGIGHLPLNLPEGNYHFARDTFANHFSTDKLAFASIIWGLGAYQFLKYKNSKRASAKLVCKSQNAHITSIVTAVNFVRDLINTPTDDLGPSEFAKITQDLAKRYDASFQQIVGEALLRENYAAIYTVGRASNDPPRLLDLRWGNPKHPKVTLVGKGVCFDSGGLNIKPSNHMYPMHKDMGGAAHALGLGQLVMENRIPICLRILLPVVENVIGGSAYKPGDVIKSRKGITIEVGNTDAEGRLILADALTEAVSESPELLIDLSTLTGAARVAVGTEISAFFCNENKLADDMMRYSERYQDPMWPMPLFASYRDSLNSCIADINNVSCDPYAGAITAALFLKEFVPDNIPWLHFDMGAWNFRARPGHPIGGEAMGLRALFAYLAERYR